MDSEKQGCSKRAAQPPTNDFTLSMRGVGGGVATEGLVFKWPFNTLSLFTPPQLAGFQSGHMGNIQSRSVPQKETKDTTCMLMRWEAFKEGNTAEAEAWSVPLFLEKAQGCKTEAQARNWFWLLFFLTNRKRRNKKNLKCATIWGRECCKIDFLPP